MIAEPLIRDGFWNPGGIGGAFLTEGEINEAESLLSLSRSGVQGPGRGVPWTEGVVTELTGLHGIQAAMGGWWGGEEAMSAWAVGGGALQNPQLVSSYPDATEGDGPECASVWENTFACGPHGSCGIGRIRVGCVNRKPCKVAGETCKIKEDKSGCECGPRYPPPPELFTCCCCVDKVEIHENNPRLPIDLDTDKDPKLWRYGQKFTVRAKLKHKGTSGKKCKCTMSWSEYANRDYDYEGKEKALLGGRWNRLSDKAWAGKYEADTGTACYDTSVEFNTDTPGMSIRQKNPTEWEIFIEVCVYSCDKGDCHCEHKKKCVRLHQIVKQTGVNQGEAVLTVSDDEGRLTDDMKDPPEESPGGWISEEKRKREERNKKK